MPKSKRSRFTGIRYALSSYFNINTSQQRGNIVLIVLLFIGIGIYYFLPFFFRPAKYKLDEFEKEIALFESSLKPKDSLYYAQKQESNLKSKYDTLNLFQFNPNELNNEKYLKLGFSEKQIRMLRNYLNKGGKFKTKSDFRKLYGLHPVQYSYLEPYIDLPADKTSPIEEISFSSKTKLENKDTELFLFNPNTASISELKKLGLTEKQAQVIQNYLAKGGKFRTKEDFKKIYCIKEELYNKLENYIDIPQTKIADNNNNLKKETPKVKIDINTENPQELMEINGIGDYLSHAIIKYKHILGGYYSIDQLNEVYGLKQETFEKIKGQIKVSKESITKIKINFANLDEIKKHPYFGYMKAKKIIDYRNKSGKIRNSEELDNILHCTENEFNKLIVYVQF